MPKSRIIPPFIIGDKDNLWGGLNTANKDYRSLKRGESFDSLNWLTGRDQDHIELRRGQKLLGTTRRNVLNSKITGLGVGVRIDGQEVPFYTFKRKVMFYNSTTDDTQEVNTTDLLPAEANDEETSFATYENLAGSFMYLTSPNSSNYKIATANPGYPLDQMTKDYHFGFSKIDRSRFFGVNRKGQYMNSKDTTGLYISHVDKQLITDYNTNYMSVPQKPLLIQNTGGSIADGTYYFVLTAFGPEGVETTQSAEGTIVVAGGLGTASIDVVFPNVAGATSYNIYISLISGNYTSPALAKSGVIPVVSPVQNTVQITDSTPSAGTPPLTTTQGIIAPLGVGNGVTVTFAGTLPNLASPKTVFYVSIDGGIEVFADDKSGNLVGNQGGTGTINYITGAYSVTFDSAPLVGFNVTAAYYEEDATDKGIMDFNIDTTDTTNASAQIFRQDDGGGKAQAVFAYQGVQYCFHVLRSWQLSIGQGTDVSGNPSTVFDNQPYYEQIGIPSPRAAFQTGDGILFLNNSNRANPTLSALSIPAGSTNLTVTPVSLSDALDLSSFGFDSCVVWHWGDYDIVSCMDRVNGFLDTFNSVTFVRNSISGIWNRLDYSINCLDEFQGALLMGDSISANCFTLFSGFDDDEAAIDNHHKMAYTDLGIQGLKKVGYLNLQGLIQESQKLEVWISLDNGAYVLAYTILGNGPYVSQNVVAVGTETIGQTVVGGGNGNQQIFANEYELDVPIHTDKFEYISFMVRAIDVGYVSVNRSEYKDIRFKRRRILQSEDLEISQ